MDGEKPISWIKVTIAVVLAVVIIGLLIYLFSRSNVGSQGELQLLHEWAMLQLNAPSMPLLM